MEIFSGKRSLEHVSLLNSEDDSTDDEATLFTRNGDIEMSLVDKPRKKIKPRERSRGRGPRSSCYCAAVCFSVVSLIVSLGALVVVLVSTQGWWYLLGLGGHNVTNTANTGSTGNTGNHGYKQPPFLNKSTDIFPRDANDWNMTFRKQGMFVSYFICY